MLAYVRQLLDTSQPPLDDVFTYSITEDHQITYHEARFSRSNQETVLVLIRDVTRQKRLEQEMEEQRSLLETFFQSLPDPTVIANPNREIIKINRAVKPVFGYEPESLIGKPSAVLYASQDDFYKQGSARYNPDSQSQNEQYAVSYKRANGEVFTSETIGSVIRTEAGMLIG